MFDRVRERVTSAHLLGLLALFVALGGTAGALAGRNTVDSGDVERNALKKKDLKRNSVDRAEIRTGAVGPEEAGSALGVGLFLARARGVQLGPGETGFFAASGFTQGAATNPNDVALPLPPDATDTILIYDFSASVTGDLGPGGAIVQLAEGLAPPVQGGILLNCQFDDSEPSCTSPDNEFAQPASVASNAIYANVIPASTSNGIDGDVSITWRAVTP
jgi:hypothetical protein